MSMISPEAYVDEYKDMSYEELLPLRDELIDGIKALEKSDSIWAYPNNTKYQCDLEYPGKLCELIADKFNDLLWKDKEE